MAPGGTRRDELSRTLRRIPATSARQQGPRPRALRGSDAGLAAAAFVRARGESVRGAAAARRPGLGGDGGAGGRGGHSPRGLKSELELTVDGADEVEPQQGLWRALVREGSSRRPRDPRVEVRAEDGRRSSVCDRQLEGDHRSPDRADRRCPGGRAVDPLDPWRGRHRLFLKMADTVLVGDGSAVRELSR